MVQISAVFCASVHTIELESLEHQAINKVAIDKIGKTNNNFFISKLDKLIKNSLVLI
jgi:hypothetical protein